ncbi:RICIN domain-containing protein [Streptomyces sp. NPDC059781]|uniref:RICIN domain-containing protein n=1 Tax=Streptomyces sp. NPDC059781 TaxID=3346943 RepID=UPI00364DEA1A
MPRQHEPPAGGATPAVAVRRAVSVPAPGNDPGADLRPRGPEPVPASGSAAEPAAAEEGRQQEQKEEQKQEQEREQQQQRQAAEPDGAEAEAAVGVVAAGNGDGAKADADADEAVPGRLRGPMVAAAAIVGAVLICVPLLVLGLIREEDRTVETAPVGGTTLDPGTSDDIPAADYQAASPSSSASPSGAASASGSPAGAEPKSEPKSESESEPSPSRSAEVKAAPRPATQKATDGKETPKAKNSPAITPRQLANALSTRVNAQLKNVATGKCADLPYFEKGSVDGPVSQYNCRPTTKDNQLWDLEVADSNGGPGGASLFVIRNRKDGLCMDLPHYGSVAAGTKVTEYHCRPAADNQLWWLDPRSGGYWIRNAASNLCMSVVGGSSAGNDARLQVARCGSGTGEQRWSVVSVVKPS